MKAAPIACLATVLLASAAGAQTVYRCGPEGRSYGHQPCAEGRRVELVDARSEADRRDGESVALREARLVRAMEGQRLAAQPKATGPVRLDLRRSTSPAGRAAPQRAKPFRAVSGVTKAKPKKRQTA